MTLKPLSSSPYFSAFLAACEGPEDLQRLYRAVRAGWTDSELAALARRLRSKPFAKMTARDLRSAIMSADNHDYFARLTIKELRAAQRRLAGATHSQKSTMNDIYN